MDIGNESGRTRKEDEMIKRMYKTIVLYIRWNRLICEINAFDAWFHNIYSKKTNSHHIQQLLCKQ